MRNIPLRVCPWIAGLGLLATAIVLAMGSISDPNLWRTADQQGQKAEQAGAHERAAKIYDDPMRQGAALFRAGDFKEAADVFARVGGAEGAFNQGDALLMHGAYEDAIKAYDRALSIRPGWQLAIENRNLAIVRKALIEGVPDDQTGDLEEPNSIVLENVNNNRAKPVRINAGEPVSDDQLRTTWLRRVQTKPADFLRAKFAYQLQQPAAGGNGR